MSVHPLHAAELLLRAAHAARLAERAVKYGRYKRARRLAQLARRLLEASREPVDVPPPRLRRQPPH